MGNYFWWYSRQRFIASAVGKCKRNVNILSIILVQDFRLKLKLLAISYRISSYSNRDCDWLILACFIGEQSMAGGTLLV